jgi:uncharacterized protein (TIGR03083 family)
MTGEIMTAISADRLRSAIIGETETLASLVTGADFSVPVPTCPEWTLRQLTTHVGRAQRWAAEIVSTRAAEPVPFRQVPDGRLPDDPAERPAWLRAGAARLARVLGAAGDAPVWTNDGPGVASYWGRRMTHETAVHRADGQLALGQRPVIDPVIAADGIDEWLGMVTTPDPGEQAQRLVKLWDGHSLHVHTTGAGPAGEWTVRGGSGALTLEPGHGKGDVAVRGPASALLLMLVRRLPPDDPDIEVFGDRALLDAWLGVTQF